MNANTPPNQSVIRRLRTVQNLGLTDRVVRGAIAVLMIAGPIIDLMRGSSFSWHGYVILLGVYPALTAIFGWDPFYAMFKIRSCGTSQRTQCGTFPYEIDAALGNNPVPNKGYEFDHSLSSANHKTV